MNNRIEYKSAITINIEQTEEGKKTYELLRKALDFFWNIRIDFPNALFQIETDSTPITEEEGNA